MATMLLKKHKQVTKKITSNLGDRALDVILSRFGLDPKDLNRRTLEEIGNKYNITRERVRQIEQNAISLIKKSDLYKKEQAFFEELRGVIQQLGSIVSEHELLDFLSKEKLSQNHFHFYLVLGDYFKKHKEDDHFNHRWSVDDKLAQGVHDALINLYSNLKDDELVTETEMIKRFLDEMKDVAEFYKNEEIIKRWLNISKKISKNPIGEWGKSDSSAIKTRGVKDYAFLVMRKHGSPMHFKEVAESITKIFGKKTHPATTHNELIKDKRFVLVGRGLYALSEWGYKTGTAKDVIKEVLKKEGPLKKEDILSKVMKERYFKKNTILVNLANSKNFKKNKEGFYTSI